MRQGSRAEAAPRAMTSRREGVMGAKSINVEEADRTVRIRSLAQRCRDLSEMTAIPEVTRELISIADELENEIRPAGEE